jgi:hypothetical protein
MIFKRITPMLVAGDVLQHNHYAFLPGKGTASKLIQLLNVLEEVVENDLDVDLSTSDVKGLTPLSALLNMRAEGE